MDDEDGANFVFSAGCTDGLTVAATKLPTDNVNQSPTTCNREKEEEKKERNETLFYNAKWPLIVS